MGSVTSPSPGVADLLQILSSAGSPSLSSTLSSSSVQSALQNAPPADLVQLSDRALELQLVNGLFASQDSILANVLTPLNPSAGGSTSTPSSSTTLLNNILATLNPPTSSPTTPNTSAATPPPSLADQFTAYQNQLQSEQVQALLGINTTSTFVNLLA